MKEVQLGSRTLQPWRQLLASGQREPLGKRALDILSVLAEAQGEIVTKDELLRAVWRDAIVEENALQVQIVALRKALGPDAGRVQTIRGVGYRLDIEPEEARRPSEEVAGAAPAGVGSRAWLTRRSLAGGLIGVAALGAIGFFALPRASSSAPPGVEPLLDQAWQAWTQGTSEGNSQAIGLYRRALELAPDFADTWGLLACAYADRAQAWVSAAEQSALRRQSREAARRALHLDSHNAMGRVALAYARPVRGNWSLMEREFRRARQDQPEKPFTAFALAWLFVQVGRLSEAADLFGLLGGGAPVANLYFYRASALWGSGRIEEAEQLLREADAIYGSHDRIRRLHLDMLIDSGQLRQALALVEDAAGRASGPSRQWFNRRAAVLRAMVDGNERAALAVRDDLLRQGRESADWATRSIIDLTVLGHLDDAYSLAEAFYFSRGFSIPDVRSADSQPVAVTLDARWTGFLFVPLLAPMRADGRFVSLVKELGLVRYWGGAGAQPDYRRL